MTAIDIDLGLISLSFVFRWYLLLAVRQDSVLFFFFLIFRSLSSPSLALPLFSVSFSFSDVWCRRLWFWFSNISLLVLLAARCICCESDRMK